MLRVRPLVHTSDIQGSVRFLRALGLRAAEAPDRSSKVLDAGSGRVALQSCEPHAREDGSTALAFEVSDVEEFARRTIEAGTGVVLSDEGHGRAGSVTAGDGTSFLAGVGPRDTGAPASPLAVLALWFTPDVDQGAQVLENIGAKPRISPVTGEWYDFSAKNGGLVAVHAGRRTVIGLAFEYDGDVRDLVAPLAAAGFEPVVLDEDHGRSLGVRSPWGAEVRVNERLRNIGPRMR
jgi:hypothetical protein